MLRDLATARRVDVALAAGMGAWAAPDVPWWWRPPGHVPATPVVLGYLVLALASSVPFLWWRRAPAAVLAITGGVLVTRLGLGKNPTEALAAFLVAAYGIGAFAAGARRSARWAGWGCLTAAAALTVTWNSHRQTGLPFVLLGAAFLLGDAATARRAEAAAAVEAAHLAERARIARELHDVLSHQLSAIAVNAGAARLTGVTPPDLPATVERLSREALTELNHLLGVLRRDGPGERDGTGETGAAGRTGTADGSGARAGLSERRPAPSLAEMSTLLTGARQAGVPADLAVTGRIREISPGLQLSAYRIVQESLTNVARHAPGAATRVTLRYLDDHLAIEVVNEPCERPRRGRPQTGGRGLLGMRERAESYGGSLHAAPTAADGFAVAAALPYDTTPAGGI